MSSGAEQTASDDRRSSILTRPLLSDRIGRVRVMATFGIIGLVMIYPLFRWLIAAPTIANLITIQALIALVFYCGYYATVPAALADLFPTRRRTTGVSISYVLAQTLFGGITPLVVGWIVTTTNDPTSPGLYLSAVMILSLACLIATLWLSPAPATSTTTVEAAD